MTATTVHIHLEPADLANTEVRIVDGLPYPMTTLDFGGGGHVTASKMPSSEFADKLRELADRVEAANAGRYARGCEQGAA